MNRALAYILEKHKCSGKESPIEIFGGRFAGGLATLLKELEFNIGAEVGVAAGNFSSVLCAENPNLKLYCIDAWTTYSGYKDYRDQNQLDLFYEQTKNRLSEKNVEIIRDWSLNAVKSFNDESLDFVFIDGNHDFQNVTNDIAEWSKKVRRGGIIAGHDYFDSYKGSSYGVKAVVHAWTSFYHISPWFIIRGDVCPSWMWIKK